MRTLNNLQTTAVNSKTPTPQYFIEIELNETLRLSTYDTVDWNGYTWSKGSVQLEYVSPEEVRLSVENDSYQHSINAMTGVYLRNAVKVWSATKPPVTNYVKSGYWKSGYTTGRGYPYSKPILIFEGVIYGTPSVDQWLEVLCRRNPPKSYPFKKIRPPIANHLPGDGYVIEFDGNVLTVEGEE